jgi:hypothetical protein
MHASTFVTAAGTDATVPSYGCAIFNGNSSSLYITDPVAPKGSGAAGASSCEQVTLCGLGGAGGELTGSLAELLVYSGIHDQAQRTAVMSYLKNRYFP